MRSRFSPGGPGDKPLYETGEDISARSDRDSTMSWTQFVEFGTSERGELSLQWEQDLKEHFGSYFELGGRLVLKNIPFRSYNLQPSLVATLGMGTADFNEYIYGVGAADSLAVNNYSVGLQLNVPPAIDHLFPIFKIQYYEVLGSSNRNASLVSGDEKGFQAMLIVAFKVFENQ